MHDKWEGNRLLGYDIAIIKLDRPTCVQPVKFIGKRDSVQEHFTVFGFGRTGSSGEFSSELEGGHLKFISRSECNKNFNLPVKMGWDSVCFKTAGGVAGICAGFSHLNFVSLSQCISPMSRRRGWSYHACTIHPSL